MLGFRIIIAFILFYIPSALASEIYCYDGDTCYYQNIPMRLISVDTPELPTVKGYEAKRFVNNIVRNANNILIKYKGEGYYKRFLVDIIVDGESLSEIIIKSGYGKRVLWIKVKINFIGKEKRKETLS